MTNRRHTYGLWFCLTALALLALLGAASIAAADESAAYKRAKADYFWLMKHDDAKGVYHNWVSLAERFSRIYTAEPSGPLAPGCLLWTGRIFAGAYDQFKQKKDLDKASDALKRLINHFPDSNLADDAQLMIAELHIKHGDVKTAYLELLKVVVNYPNGDMAPEAKKRLDELERTLAPRYLTGDEPAPKSVARPTQEPTRPAGPDLSLAQVVELRHWSTPSYTRVVLNLDRSAPYTAKVHNAGRAADGSRQLRMDLSGVRLAGGIKVGAPQAGGLLDDVRARQLDAETVRVSLDVKELGSYKVFTLDNPFRVVIDCFADKGPSSVAKSSVKPSVKGKKRVPRGKAQQEPSDLSLIKALGLGVRTVVIDPGHGGKDPGCVAGGLREKDITLDLAKRVAKRLRDQLGCRVILTRDSDRTLSLEERTAIANTNDADLFVSIHVNAAPSQKLSGLETYFLNLASDEQSMMVAARENATTTRTIGDLQVILNDLMLNSKINESNRMARDLHAGLVRRIRAKRADVRDLGVKQAPFYVLIGARMPSVLVEVGFITNPTERKLLATSAYRQHLADGIADGVISYARGLKSGN